jgi:hypothetical protein
MDEIFKKHAVPTGAKLPLIQMLPNAAVGFCG